MLRKDLSEIKYSYATRINDLERENKEYNDTLASTKRLADMQMKENRKLLEKENIRNKEKRVLKKELKLMEDEHVKAIEKNKDLKIKLDRLDKIVYGKKIVKNSARFME